MKETNKNLRNFICSACGIKSIAAFIFHVLTLTRSSEKKVAYGDSNQNAHTNPVVVRHEGEHEKVAYCQLQRVQTSLHHMLKTEHFDYVQFELGLSVEFLVYLVDLSSHLGSAYFVADKLEAFKNDGY